MGIFGVIFLPGISIYPIVAEVFISEIERKLERYEYT